MMASEETQDALEFEVTDLIENLNIRMCFLFIRPRSQILI